ASNRTGCETCRKAAGDLPIMTRCFIVGLAALVVLCVGATLMFPSAKGPFSSIYGPATSLQTNNDPVRVCIAPALDPPLTSRPEAMPLRPFLDSCGPILKVTNPPARDFMLPLLC